jgi:hypothetical protein
MYDKVSYLIDIGVDGEFVFEVTFISIQNKIFFFDICQLKKLNTMYTKKEKCVDIDNRNCD